MGDFPSSQVEEALTDLREKIHYLRLPEETLDLYAEINIYGAQIVFTPDMKFIIAYGTVVGIPKPKEPFKQKGYLE